MVCTSDPSPIRMGLDVKQRGKAVDQAKVLERIKFIEDVLFAEGKALYLSFEVIQKLKAQLAELKAKIQ